MSSKIGFHASHELYAPSRLLAFAQRAQRFGFIHAMCSDHFHPWTPSQGQSGFTWSWLGAAMQATQMSFGMVCAPGQRYHPAIIAQAAATLAEMFPGRLWTSFGSGEAVNESITGDAWPTKRVRNARLAECVSVIRRLWAGQTVTHDGEVKVREATLYTRPARPPELYVAAISAKTAAWASEWADGLVTTGGVGLKEKIEAFRENGQDKPVFVQSAISYAATDRDAIAAARKNWPIASLNVEQIEDLPTPRAMAEHSERVSQSELRDGFGVSSSIQQHTDWIAADLDAGATRIYLHHIGDDMERFIDTFGEKVLPKFQ